MNIFAVVSLALACAILASVLRRYSPEFGVYISLICGVIIFANVLSAISPAISAITDTAGTAGGVYATALLKSLAVCHVCGLARDACADAGESAIASKIDIACKAAVLLIALPLWRELADLVTGLL